MELTYYIDRGETEIELAIIADVYRAGGDGWNEPRYSEDVDIWSVRNADTLEDVEITDDERHKIAICALEEYADHLETEAAKKCDAEEDMMKEEQE